MENQNPPPTADNQNPNSQNAPVIPDPPVPNPTEGIRNPEPSATQSPKPTRKFSKALIFGVLAFLILAGAAFAFKNPIMKMVSKPTPTPAPVVSKPSPTPADMLIYYKSKVGNLFSFAYYPTLWEPRKPVEGGTEEHTFYLKSETETVWFGISPAKDSLVNFSKYLPITTKKTDITFNGYNGISYEENESINDKFTRTIILEDTDKKSIASIYYSAFTKNSYDSHMKDLEKILSSFTFADVINETSPGYSKVKELDSPDKKYKVIEGVIPDIKIITIKDSSGKTLEENLTVTNYDEIITNLKKQGLTGGGQMGYLVKEWKDNTVFVLSILPASGDEFEVEVDAPTAKINYSTLKKIK